MSLTRMEFIKISGGVAVAALAGPLLTEQEPKRIKAFGIQLYSVKDDMLKDPTGVLQKLAGYGYKQIESYEGPKGMFWGLGNKGFKKIMDDLDMTIISSHFDPEIELDKKAEEAAAIGMKYLIYNWPGKTETLDEFKRKAELFNRWGMTCQKTGLRFANHNYDASFKAIDGQYPQDILMQQTDKPLVDFQLDFYWAILGGANPVDWLKKYPGRFRLCHIKDRTKGSTKREDTCDLGTGSIDFPSILKTARKNGMQYYFAEQEHYINSPLQSAEADANYMKSLRI